MFLAFGAAEYVSWLTRLSVQTALSNLLSAEYLSFGQLFTSFFDVHVVHATENIPTDPILLPIPIVAAGYADESQSKPFPMLSLFLEDPTSSAE